jgi:hypothetical protein
LSPKSAVGAPDDRSKSILPVEADQKPVLDPQITVESNVSLRSGVLDAAQVARSDNDKLSDGKSPASCTSPVL